MNLEFEGSTHVISIGKEGPIEELIYADFKYLPLKPSGLLSETAIINDRILSNKLSLTKLALPIPACIIPFFSTLN